MRVETLECGYQPGVFAPTASSEPAPCVERRSTTRRCACRRRPGPRQSTRVWLADYTSTTGGNATPSHDARRLCTTEYFCFESVALRRLTGGEVLADSEDATYQCGGTRPRPSIGPGHPHAGGACGFSCWQSRPLGYFWKGGERFASGILEYGYWIRKGSYCIPPPPSRFSPGSGVGRSSATDDCSRPGLVRAIRASRFGTPCRLGRAAQVDS